MTADELKEKMKSRTWRLNHLYWIMDDHGRKVKFTMNPNQRLLYRALWWLNLIPKSRQHGITTLVALLFLDMCLFTPNLRAGIIAHKLVDAKRIFRDKIKYAYDHLNAELRAQMPLAKDDQQEIVFAHNNSGIYVGTTMHSATFQLLHITEYGWLCQHAPLRAAEIKSALETVHEGGIIIIESTVEGVGDDFQAMCDVAERKMRLKTPLTRMDYKLFFFAWFTKPENVLHEPVEISEEFQQYFTKVEVETGQTIDQPHRNWYVKKKETLAERIYNQHPSTFEEAFLASIEGSYYGRYMVAAWEQGRICELPHEESALVYTWWDLGDMHTSVWFVQFIGDWIHCIDFYRDENGVGEKVYAKMIETKPYNYGAHFCGPDMLTSNKKRSGKMVIDTYADLGIHFTPVAPHSIMDRHAKTRLILNKTKWDKRRCSDGIKGLTNYRKEKNELASTEEVTVYKEEPLHDWASHDADAFGHGAIAYFFNKIGGVLLGQRGKQAFRPPSQQTGVKDLLSV